MVYRYILLLKHELLAECNGPNCFISAPLPGLLSVFPYFSVLVLKIAVLEVAMERLASLQRNDSLWSTLRAYREVVGARNVDLLVFAKPPKTNFSRTRS